jgi:uncharacterized membrane protein
LKFAKRQRGQAASAINLTSFSYLHLVKQFSRKRHIAKAITWRTIGTLDTILLGWFLTGELKTGMSIGATELITKMVLYYFHERIWYKLDVFKLDNSRVRHILKTITWRFVGTIDTILLGWIITGKAEIGLTIGGLELFTKMILYYAHERVWYKSDFGLIQHAKNTSGLHE